MKSASVDFGFQTSHIFLVRFPLQGFPEAGEVFFVHLVCQFRHKALFQLHQVILGGEAGKVLLEKVHQPLGVLVAELPPQNVVDIRESNQHGFSLAAKLCDTYRHPSTEGFLRSSR